MSNLNNNTYIIVEKVSFDMVGIYKWIIEDKIDERDFLEKTMTEFINEAIKNELIKREVDLTPIRERKLDDWF